MTAIRTRPARGAETLAVAEGAPAPLSPAQRRLVDEALVRAEETRNVMEDALVNFGRWVLLRVFDNDAKAALDARHDNPVWRDLLARAGGPTLRLSERMLYVSLLIAARDKRIGDEAWRNLEPGRKAILLPLGDDALLREAAQHVVALKLTQRATRAYVAGLLAQRGEAPQVRLTAPRLARQVGSFRARVTSAGFRQKAAKLLNEADPELRAAARRDLTALKAWAEDLLQKSSRKR